MFLYRLTGAYGGSPAQIRGYNQPFRSSPPMRMMLKVRIPVEAGNAGFKDGSLGKTIQETMEVLKPESAYFFAEDGQ